MLYEKVSDKRFWNYNRSYTETKGINELHSFDMYFIATLIVLLSSCNDLTTGVTVTYDELKELNATCYPEDTCFRRINKFDASLSMSYSCSCDSLCSYYSTCCMDSNYSSIRPPVLQPTCRAMKLSDKAYSVIDRCSSGGDNGNSIWEPLCHDNQNEDNDVMRLVPVMSLSTFKTYRNYFCFRCHETTDRFLYWKIMLTSRTTHKIQPQANLEGLTYSKNIQSWVVTLKRINVSIPVELKLQAPGGSYPSPVECDSSVIAICSDTWTDNSIRDRCNAYMAVIYIKRDGGFLKYRNAHCALCNFESLDHLLCKKRFETSLGGYDYNGYSYGYDAGVGKGRPRDYYPLIMSGGKVPFSFTHLLDINLSDGDRVGRMQKCGENSLWDPFAKQCRNLTCALPRHVIKERKCIPP